MSKAKKQRRVRRNFAREFKADVVRMCQAEGATTAGVCRRLDLTENSVRASIKQAKVDEGGGGEGLLTTDERAEMAELRRRSREVTQERDILKEATAFSAKESS